MWFSLQISRGLSSRLLRDLAPLVRPPESALYCVDAVNAFDPYAFVQAARLWKADPDEVLGRVWITRTFTIHQLCAVAEDMVPALFAEGAGPPPAFVLLGLDHLFREESLPERERALVLNRVLAALEGLPAEAELLMTYEPPPTHEPFWLPLRAFGGVRGRVRLLSNEELCLEIEETPDGTHRTDFQHVAARGGGLLACLSASLARGA
ncbi:MAG: hypothetical protein RLY93_08345 [Sumerlaeia bacterium]